MIDLCPDDKQRIVHERRILDASIGAQILRDKGHFYRNPPALVDLLLSV